MNRLAIIDAESRRFAEVLAHTAPDARCPTCPDWTAADLLWHLTEVHLFWAAVLFRNVTAEDGVAAVEQSKPSRPDSVADLLALREGATSVLLAELSRLDDAEPRWSWFPSDQTVGFTRRMQTYEALMHRVDAELAAGLPIGAIAADVAAGAVDTRWTSCGPGSRRVRTSRGPRWSSSSRPTPRSAGRSMSVRPVTGRARFAARTRRW